MRQGESPAPITPRDMNSTKKGTRVKFLQDGRIKKGVITDTVPTLWGGETLTVKVGVREITIDAKAIIK